MPDKGREQRGYGNSAAAVEIRRVIINYCAPVLMGVRPAALFSLHTEGCTERLSGALPPAVNLMVLRKTGAGALVILFEKGLLERTLLHEPVRSLLTEMGYPGTTAGLRSRRGIYGGSPVFAYLDCLRQKIERFHQFPHEIGLFLGYPPDDVLGFMEHKGQNYKLSGYRKVYGSVEKAKNDFYCYELCRRYMRFYLQNGGLLRDFEAVGLVHPFFTPRVRKCRPICVTRAWAYSSSRSLQSL